MVVFGLGNPGALYLGTRHNVGFETLEIIARSKGLKFHKPLLKPYRKASSPGLTLVEPLTYMNESGRAVPDNVREGELLVVLADQMDLPPGKIRIRRGGSSCGHNGLKSIIACFGEGFLRIYIGVGRPGAGVSSADHVLSRFSPEDRIAIDQAETKAAEAVLRLYAGEKLEKVVQWANS